MGLTWLKEPVIALYFFLRKKRKRCYIIDNLSFLYRSKTELYKLKKIIIIIKMKLIIKIVIIIN